MRSAANVWAQFVVINLLGLGSLLWLYYGSPPAEARALIDFWWLAKAIILTVLAFFLVFAEAKKVHGAGGGPAFPVWMKWSYRVSSIAQVPLLIFLGWYYTASVLLICIVMLIKRTSQWERG